MPRKASRAKSQLKRLKLKAWNLTSIKVRTTGVDRDGYNECYTCRVKKHWKELHCGHHFHGKLDYDVRNLRPQCSRCNWQLHGNLGVYAERLIEENGLAWYKKLKYDANKIIKYDRLMLQEIIEKLSTEISRHV